MRKAYIVVVFDNPESRKIFKIDSVHLDPDLAQEYCEASSRCYRLAGGREYCEVQVKPLIERGE